MLTTQPCCVEFSRGSSSCVIDALHLGEFKKKKNTEFSSQKLFLTWRLAVTYANHKPLFSKCKFYSSFLCWDAPALLSLDQMSVCEVRSV